MIHSCCSLGPHGKAGADVEALAIEEGELELVVEAVVSEEEEEGEDGIELEVDTDAFADIFLCVESVFLKTNKIVFF